MINKIMKALGMSQEDIITRKTDEIREVIRNRMTIPVYRPQVDEKLVAKIRQKQRQRDLILFGWSIIPEEEEETNEV